MANVTLQNPIIAFPVTPQIKLWGHTRRLHSDSHCEVCHAKIKKGGFSSQHRHEHKDNMFYVLSGTLFVYVYANYQKLPPVKTYQIEAGQQIIIPAGTWHQFEARTDVELIETYWVRLNTEDITRADEGGILNGD